MPHSSKEWLVRTKQRDILGPFTLRELIGELNQKTFSAEDEIATSGGHWISAQTLLHREVEEVTRTSTKQVTQSITEDKKILEKEPAVTPPTPTPPTPPNKLETKKKVTTVGAGAVTVTLLLVFIVIQWLRSSSPSPKLANVTPAQVTAEPKTALTKSVYTMIQRGETKQALKKLTESHERGSEGAELEYLIPYAALLITEGESPSRAKRFLEQILSSNAPITQKAKAHHWMGYLMLSEGEGDMGENHFLEALQLQPKDAIARFNLGRAYLKQNRFSQALDYFQLAELEVPDFWLIHLFKGRAKSALGHSEDAGKSFLQAIRSSPERWKTYIYYAVFLKNSGDIEEAQTILKRMLLQDPYYEIQSPAPFGYFVEHVDYEEYLTTFTKYMERYPGEERELGRLYLTYLMSKQNGNASLVGKQIEQLAGRNSLFSKILILKVLLDRNAPASEMKAILEKLPPNLNDFGYYAYALRGEVRLKNGHASEALKDFERALILEPKSAIAHHMYASLLKAVNRRGDAEKELNSLLGYHPTYIPGLISAQDF